ncbi:Retinoblastoma-like protein 1 [Eumeta japonica]|uniref:Retinoblastoma-like protein 1 n=1 Tax=Eumeta variegata TaxID=151549 RepID=A0A4C1XJW4_EUMVA|nr:Retinoblastoma-like protein 1 [Eumeta japonica]
MPSSDENEDNIQAKFQDLCSKLNVDKQATEQSWESYHLISQNYTLEGDPSHWLACALYVACRKSITPTLQSGKAVEGNCVSLTRLLRLCNIRLLPCTENALFEFTWCLYVCVKGEFHNSANDLVDMYHVLLSCLDFVFANAFMARRTDLINPNFKGLPRDWDSENYELPSKAPCIISKLCEMKEALSVEAATTKEYSWKPVIESFFEKGILKGDSQTLTGLLDIGFFDVNLKSLNNLYETYVLSVGEFDERIFLGEHANTDSGTSGNMIGEQISKTIATFGPNARPHAPDTPLTGRRYLRERTELLSPVSEATNSVGRLCNYLASCRPQPSAHLLQLFSESGITENMIKTHAIEPCKRWQEILATSLRESSCSNERIELRTNMVTCLHFKVLEHILREERRKKPQVSLHVWLTQEFLQLTVYACCTEVVLLAYGAHSMRFPKVLQVFDLSAFHFYKIIELVVQAVMDKLSRDSIKHLNAVEEQALESLVWCGDSPLWARLQVGRVPPSADVYHDSPSPSGPPHAAHAAYQRRQNGGMQSPVSTGERGAIPAADLAKKQLFKDNIKPGQSLLVSTNAVVIKAELGTNSTAANADSLTPKKGVKSDSLVLFFRKGSNTAANPVERTFAEIMRYYRQQPQADNYVYRSVLIGPSSGPDGSAERGDLIQFYNKVYVQCMQLFALRFTGKHKDECSLSPLPAGRGEAARSPLSQRVSERHRVYVKPLTEPPPHNHQLTYRFSRSPAKDLHAINTMLSGDPGAEGSGANFMAVKRALDGATAAKRPRYAPGVARKLQGLMTDRQVV